MTTQEHTSHNEMDRLLQACHSAQAAQRKVLQRLVRESDPDADWEDLSPTLRLLLAYLLDRGTAALRLVALRLDFDAEILLRTFYEGSAKLLLIGLSASDQQQRLLSEFWTGLGEVADRKGSQRARLAEAILPDTRQDARNTLNLLHKPHMVRNTLKLDRAARRRLEQRWSFPEIVRQLNALVRSDPPAAASLLHMYGMSSHLAHADCRALELYLDRLYRPSEERIALEDAHAARIMSDVSQIGAYCVLVTAAVAKLSSAADLDEVSTTATVSAKIAEAVISSFDASQRAFYASMLADEPTT